MTRWGVSWDAPPGGDPYAREQKVPSVAPMHAGLYSPERAAANGYHPTREAAARAALAQLRRSVAEDVRRLALLGALLRAERLRGAVEREWRA